MFTSEIMSWGFKDSNRVRFNDSWFVFHDSSWSFNELNFSKKHIFHESYRLSRTYDYDLETYKKVLNYSTLSKFQDHSYRRFPTSSISLLSKSLVNKIFTELKITNWNDETFNIKTFIYYVIHSGARKAFRKVILQKEIWFAR